MKSQSLVALLGAFAATASAGQMSEMVMTVKAAPADSLKSSTGGNILDVAVGMNKNMFTPSSVAAKLGDVVRFSMFDQNNSVAQSSFDSPCTPLSGGFVSGFKQNVPGQLPPTFDVPVKDSSPLWMFAQGNNACQSGQVFAINPPTTDASQTIATFMIKAVSENKQLTSVSSSSSSSSDTFIAQNAPQQQAGSQVLTFNVQGQGSSSSVSNGGVAVPATTVVGQGMTGQGTACGCTCLCGMNSFPQNAGTGMFGGFLGEMPAAPQQVSASAAIAAPSKRSETMPRRIRA